MGGSESSVGAGLTVTVGVACASGPPQAVLHDKSMIQHKAVKAVLVRNMKDIVSLPFSILLTIRQLRMWISSFPYIQYIVNHSAVGHLGERLNGLHNAVIREQRGKLHKG